ncbi:MAG: DUF364 domain-containing protein [bacterium]
MDLLAKTRELFAARVRGREPDLSLRISVRPLSPVEAIGPTADEDFPIRRGKEQVIEADFRGSRGQAFTDRPARWQGTLKDLLALDLEQVADRAVFVAGLNAVMRSWDQAGGTLHCRNEDPERCGPEIARIVRERFGETVRVGLIGLQPALLRALVERFGASSVTVSDLNPENIGQRRSGVSVLDGERDLAQLVEACDAGLATGSAIVNGTLDAIFGRFRSAGKPLVVYGNTIAGVAQLLGLERLCPYGR